MKRIGLLCEGHTEVECRLWQVSAAGSQCQVPLMFVGLDVRLGACDKSRQGIPVCPHLSCRGTHEGEGQVTQLPRCLSVSMFL